MTSNIEIVNKGINCLLEKLGVIETKQFISVIMREKFDYTKWQQQKFDDVSSDDFNAAAVAYAKENPIQEVTPDQWDLKMLEEIATDPGCHEFVSADDAMKELGLL